MTAHDEMAGHAIRSQSFDQIGESVDVELEDERKADKEWSLGVGGRQHLIVIAFKIKHANAVPVLRERRGQIANTEIPLILKPD
jgi:hypothetical protein